MRRYQAAVWRYLRVLGCDEVEAEDIAQETFLEVLRNPFQDRGERASGAYLLRVARNRFLKSRRGRRRVLALEEVDLAWQLLWGEDGGDAYVEALRCWLRRIEGRPRKAVELVYGESLTHRAAALELGMSRAGVTTLLRRVRECLRRCVEREVR